MFFGFRLGFVHKYCNSIHRENFNLCNGKSDNGIISRSLETHPTQNI
jgi:hypothetical protein